MRFKGLAVLAGILTFHSIGSAQTTFASITGTVTDAAGAVVPGVTVEATHVQTNYVHRASSNEAGAYTLPQLREGEYVLRASSPGFKEFQVQNIVLISRDQRRIDVRLEVGAVETRIEVNAGATLIETETARIGDSKGANTLKSLPLNTRSLYSFLGLMPGVVSSGTRATRRFAGSRVNQSEQSIDGITVSNGYDGTQISPLVSYIESYEEVRVDMANNTAEIGAVGQVSIVSKGGTNQLRGSLFDYYQSPWFRARNPFAASRGTGVSHQPGGSIGGPVVLPRLYDGRNRTFFFFSFETSRGSAIQQLINPTVPPASWRSGDFSSLLPGTAIRDPFTRTPLPGNRIPASQINPVAVKIQDRFYPLPNGGNPNLFGNRNYNEQATRAFDPNTYYTVRGDHRFSDRAFFFSRWTWNRSHSRAYEGNLPTIGQRWQTRDTRALNGSFTYTISPTLITETRYGLAFNDNPRNGPVLGKPLVQDLGLVGLVDDLPDINGLFDVSFAGLGVTRITQTQWRHPGFKNYSQQFQEHVTWSTGRHTVKSGFIVDRVNFGDQQANNALFGRVSFSNRFTAHPYSDFLYGIPTQVNRAFPPALIDRTRWGYNFFVTDDFKATRSLTLNIGLRYELTPGYSESSGLQAVFDLQRGAIVIPDGASNQISPLMPRGYVDVIEANAAGYPSQTLLRADRNNLAPRIGLAWRPFGMNTVLRAGYGVFYDVVPETTNAGGAPFVINEPAFTNSATNPTVILPRVFPASSGGPSTVGLPAAIRGDMRKPFSMQYNLTIEHQRWDTGFRISYIGTNTRQGEWAYNINQPIPDTRAFIDKARLFPRYPAINYISNGAGHQYHSLTVEIERRWKNGLSYQLSYVLSRDIGDLDRNESPENAFDRARERAVSMDIPTNRWTGNLIYELPFGRGKPFLRSVGRIGNAIVGGWEVSGIYSYFSGQFLTPQYSAPDQTGTAFTSNRTAPNVTRRPDHLRDANLDSSVRSVNRWFDPAAFAVPGPGVFGSAAKGVIIGPNSNVLHTGLMKYVPISEQMRLRFELTATNTFNHPVWSNPALNISTPATVGTINGVGGPSNNLDQAGPRRLRAGIRLEF